MTTSSKGYHEMTDFDVFENDQFDEKAVTTYVLLKQFKGLSPQEMDFNYTLSELRNVAKILGLKGFSRMSKIVLCLNIETKINEVDNHVSQY